VKLATHRMLSSSDNFIDASYPDSPVKPASKFSIQEPLYGAGMADRAGITGTECDETAGMTDRAGITGTECDETAGMTDRAGITGTECDETAGMTDRAGVTRAESDDAAGVADGAGVTGTESDDAARVADRAGVTGTESDDAARVADRAGVTGTQCGSRNHHGKCGESQYASENRETGKGQIFHKRAPGRRCAGLSVSGR
jgi:hypothetical protein